MLVHIVSTSRETETWKTYTRARAVVKLRAVLVFSTTMLGNNGSGALASAKTVDASGRTVSSIVAGPILSWVVEDELVSVDMSSGSGVLVVR